MIPQERFPCHADPRPPRPEPVEPRKPLHRLVGRRPDRAGRGRGRRRGRIAGAKGVLAERRLHLAPDPRDQDAAPRARSLRAAVDSRDQGLAAQRAALRRADRARQGRDRARSTATIRSRSGAAASTSRRPTDGGRSEFDLAQDPRYAGIAVPRTESLKLTIERVLPYWESAILPQLASGETVIVIGARQFAARAGQAPVGHLGCGHHRAGDSHRPADRLRVRRTAARRASGATSRTAEGMGADVAIVMGSQSDWPTMSAPPTCSTSWAWPTKRGSSRRTARPTGWSNSARARARGRLQGDHRRRRRRGAPARA